MGVSLVDAIVRGHRGAWIALLAAVLLVAVITLLQRGPRATPRRVLLLSGLVSALSACGTMLAMATAIPRVVWRPAPAPPFALPSGRSWRALQAPALPLLSEGRPEVALAGVDAAGKVRLFGLFSGAPLPGFKDAPPLKAAPGEPRICSLDNEDCRVWPEDWPQPAPGTQSSNFVWTQEFFSGALAYDAESDRYLHHIEGLRAAGAEVAMTGGGAAGSAAASPRAVSGTWALEQVGRLGAEASGSAPVALFIVRRIVDSRLDAVRVVAFPAGESFTYSLERATVSLSAGPWVYRWLSRPLSMALLLWFPVVSLLMQAAPAWWASRRRKRLEKGEPVSEMPSDAAVFAASARSAMAEKVYPFAVLAVGLALTAPALVAIVALVAGR